MASINPLGLRIQRLPRSTDRVLILAEIAGLRTSDGWFTPAAVRGVFDAFRIPAPNVSDSLERLCRSGYTVRDSRGGRWSLTPEGRDLVRQHAGAISEDGAEIPHWTEFGADFSHARHALIPPSLAPAKWSNPISSLLADHPFESNVLCMTRFPDPPSGPLPDPMQGLIEALRGALRRHGLTLHLASDRQLDDDLLGNVGAYMWACRYGIGLIENRADRGLNYNVIFEVGAMLMTGRRCALLKDVSAPALPTDLAGQIYKSVDFADLANATQAIHDWAANDLGLGRCADC